MQRGRVASAGEGKSISKVPPYGYLRDDNLRLHPDPETAWVVKKMFEMMRDGHGRQFIAQELDKLGSSRQVQSAKLVAYQYYRDY
jgi:site-specific DNA recombinase